MNTDAIIRNLDELIRLAERLPAELLDLNEFRHRKDCSTVYCLAGLAADSVHFQNIGWGWCDTGYQPLINGASLARSWVDEHLGPDAFTALFSVAGTSPFDQPTIGGPQPSHKELALARLRAQRKYVEAL